MFAHDTKRVIAVCKKKVVFEVIAVHREGYTLKYLCKQLKVSVSGYYKSQNSQKRESDEQWYKIIAEIKAGFKETYGYRKVTFAAQNILGLTVNHKKIYRIMVKYGLLSKIRRKKSSTYNNYNEGFINIYENELERKFSQTVPNKVWLQDITETKLSDGILYMAAIIDAHRSEVISLRYSTNNNVDLVMNAMHSAIKTRKCELAHSDRGFQYTSMAYKKLMEENGIRVSMSRPANPKDNAPMESFFGVLKTECLYRIKPKTIAEAITLTESFIDYYNNERIIIKYGGAPKKIYSLKGVTEIANI